nr:hypothetical protein CFP56_02539 [Quercus suber]
MDFKNKIPAILDDAIPDAWYKENRKEQKVLQKRYSDTTHLEKSMLGNARDSSYRLGYNMCELHSHVPISQRGETKEAADDNKQPHRYSGVMTIVKVNTFQWNPDALVVYEDPRGRILITNVICKGHVLVASSVYCYADRDMRQRWQEGKAASLRRSLLPCSCDGLGGDWNQCNCEVPFDDDWRFRNPDLFDCTSLRAQKGSNESKVRVNGPARRGSVANEPNYAEKGPSCIPTTGKPKTTRNGAPTEGWTRCKDVTQRESKELQQK